MRQRRREEFLQRLADHGVDFAVIQQNADLLYYAGTLLPSLLVFDVRQGEATLYVRRGLERAAAEVGDLPVRRFQSLTELVREMTAGRSGMRVGLELDVLPVSVFGRWQEALGSPPEDISPIVRGQRAIKDEEELLAIRDAGRVFAEAVKAVQAVLRPGVSDLELTVVAESALRKAGSQGLLRTRAFNFEMLLAHVLVGAEAAAPAVFEGPTGGVGLPYVGQGASGRLVSTDEPVLVDIATASRGYVHDGTRTLVVGSLPPRLADALTLAEEILEATRRCLRPGVLPRTCYEEAVRMAEEAGLGNHFQGYGEDRVRFLGHGVGLELDEWPVLYSGESRPLAKGMVVAVEPKFVFPGLGSVGVENTYVVTERGGEALSSLPLRPSA